MRARRAGLLPWEAFRDDGFRADDPPGWTGPEAMVQAMLTATDAEEFTADVRALDRVLTAGRYVIPTWYPAVSRLAHNRALHFPARLPLYGDWPGFQPDVWWYDEAEQ